MRIRRYFFFLAILFVCLCNPFLAFPVDLQPGPLSQFSPTDFYSSSDDQVLLAGRETSSWVSRDGGSNWECLDIPIKSVNGNNYSHIRPYMVDDSTFVFICLSDSTGAQFNNIIVSFDCGYTFEDRSPNTFNSSINPYSFTVHSEGIESWMILYANVLLYTQNSGLNWYVGLVDFEAIDQYNMNNLFKDPQNSNALYYLGNYDIWPRDPVARMGKIYRNTNGVSQWNIDEPFIDTSNLPNNNLTLIGDFLPLSNGQFLILISVSPYSVDDWQNNKLVTFRSEGQYVGRSGEDFNFEKFFFENQMVSGRIYAKVHFERFVHVSNDFGETWQELSTIGLPSLEGVQLLNFYQSHDGTTLFASFDDIGLYYSTDHGLSWQHFETFETSAFYSVFPFEENLYFADRNEYWYHQLGENTFQHISVNLSPDSTYKLGEIFYANGDTILGIVDVGPMRYRPSIRLYRTYNGGETWTMVHDQDDYAVIPFYDRYRDQFTMWRYIIHGACFFISFDYGETWEYHTGPYHPLPGWRGWRDPIYFYHDRFYTSSPLYSDDKMNIYVNYLGEEEWTNLQYPDSVSTDFPRIIPDEYGCHVMGWDRKFYEYSSLFGWQVICEMPDSIDIPLHFEFIKNNPLGFIGYDEDASNVILSTNSGHHWHTIEFILPDGQAIHKIEGFKQDLIRNRLWLSTSAGLYYYPTEDLLSSNESTFELIPADPKLFTNYPNPFNASTRIQYHLTQPGNVKLDVYDITGRLVKTLENTYKPSGMNSVHFDGKDIASGTYFIKLDTGVEVRNRRITLVK